MDSPEVRNADELIPLPGFRFHPTDEELVSFYLRRKVDKKPTSLELIKQIDIYKYNPWDLPYASSNVGDKEWYFFCKRGRKYKNSIRPNRVTGSGFWKATGIDKAVYSNGGEGNECIGLKKTLVYYRGSAGKGTKTDWMMHEFRLPGPPANPTNPKLVISKNIAQEAEIWTLCRIFKRDTTCKKYAANWKQIPSKTHMTSDKNNKVCNESGRSYINFSCEAAMISHSEKMVVAAENPNEWNNNQMHGGGQFMECNMALSPISSSVSAPMNIDANDFFTYSNWDELRPVVES